jgi:hypothetical protein
MFDQCRATAFGADDKAQGSARMERQKRRTLAAKPGISTQRRREILTRSHRHCIDSLHRFTDAAHGENR